MKQMETELDKLRASVSDMGMLTEKMVRQIAKAVKGIDQDTVFEKVIKEEDALDAMQLEIDKEAVRMLTIYSPVASDLRFVLSVTRVSAELERIGDHAKNICGSLQLMLNKANTQPIEQIQKMASLVEVMVKDSMDAFVQNDSRKARATITCDDMVDALNDQVIGEMLNDDVVRQGIEAPVDLAGAMSQILLSRSFERIGDQATNICEEVVYMVKGHDIRHQ